MLVRVKKSLGNYGHVQNGHVQPKNYASGAFEVTEEKAQELIARGIVDAVEGEPAPAPVEAPANTAETPKTAQKVAKKTAETPKKRAKKAEKAEESAENAPAFNVMGAIE